MRWYDALWVGRKAARKKGKLIASLNAGQRVPNTWLITLAENPSDTLDIIPSKMFRNPEYPAEDLYVLGIALGREEALELVEQMVDYIYRETGTLNIRDYFSD